MASIKRFAARNFSGTAGGKIIISVRNSKRLVRKFSGMKKFSQSEVVLAMKKVVLLVEAESKKLVAQGYYKPAIDTGRMRNSIAGMVVFMRNGEVRGKVGTNVHYAIYVHEGTVRMKARPFLVDALNNKRDQIRQIMGLVVSRALKSV